MATRLMETAVALPAQLRQVGIVLEVVLLVRAHAQKSEGMESQLSVLKKNEMMETLLQMMAVALYVQLNLAGPALEETLPQDTPVLILVETVKS